MPPDLRRAQAMMAKGHNRTKPGLPPLVAYVDHATDVGGAEVSLRLLLQHLDPERFRALVLHAEGAAWLKDRPPLEGATYLPVFRDTAGLHAPRDEISTGMLGNAGKILRTLGPAMALRGALRRTRPALVHSNTLKCHVIAGMAAWSVGLPIIWHLRDILREPGARAMLDRAARKLRPTIIAISQAVAKEVEHLGLPVEVIHNGVPLDDFTPGEPRADLRHEFGLENGQPVVMIVARLTPWKGHRQLIEAMPAVLARFPDARLVIVGGPHFWEGDYEDELKAVARSMNIHRALIWTGHREDIADLLRLCDVFVLPSTDEPFGRSIIEAMAVGKPVIAGNSGGVPEICTHGVCGQLIDPKDPGELAEAIVSILSDPVEAAKMGARGRDKAHRLFDAQVTAERVQDVYTRLLAP
jgi:glycosyltransferase involved in cell wall biosynthesis